MAGLSITGVQKSFSGKTVLSDVSLHLETGDVMALLGRNGCGKSTLLKILFGTEKATAIHLEFNGRVIKPSDVIPQQVISYLPQDPFLPKHLKVKDIIPICFLDGAAQDAVFYAYNMHKLANTPAGKLSMGELRYFELLLIANLHHPFLLLDEPFSMVEPLYKEKIKELLLNLTAKKGIIVTDHYYQDVLEISNKNFLLKDGTLHPVKDEAGLAALGYLN
jgi:ABC-type multidrug transport system ATPase subunit